jgi:hypothetical protein
MKIATEIFSGIINVIHVLFFSSTAFLPEPKTS